MPTCDCQIVGDVQRVICWPRAREALSSGTEARSDDRFRYAVSCWLERCHTCDLIVQFWHTMWLCCINQH